MKLYDPRTLEETKADQIVKIFFIGGGMEPLEIVLPHREDEYDPYQDFVNWFSCDTRDEMAEEYGPWGVFYWPGDEIHVFRNAIAYVVEERRKI